MNRAAHEAGGVESQCSGPLLASLIFTSTQARVGRQGGLGMHDAFSLRSNSKEHPLRCTTYASSTVQWEMTIRPSWCYAESMLLLRSLSMGCPFLNINMPNVKATNSGLRRRLTHSQCCRPKLEELRGAVGLDSQATVYKSVPRLIG